MNSCKYVIISIGAGTIFQLGEQKWTTFRLGKQKLVKHNQDNQIQSITLCNVYFSKKVYAVYNGVRSKAPDWPEAGEFSRIFALKVIDARRCIPTPLHTAPGRAPHATADWVDWVDKVTFNCKLQKTLGEQDVLVAPQ